jgi:hypothetical protein
MIQVLPQRSRKLVWKAGVGMIQFEGHGVLVERRDRLDVVYKEAVGVEAVVGHQRLNREDHVLGSERLAVGPGDALAQREGDGGEIFVVVRVAGGRTRDDLAGGEVDRPERLVGQVLHAAVAPLPANPLVEVAGRADAPGEDFGDQRLVARQVTQPGSRRVCRRCIGCWRINRRRPRFRRGRTRRQRHACQDQQAYQQHQFAFHALLLLYKPA